MNNITQLFGKGDYTDKEELKNDLRNLHKYIKESNVKKVKKMFSSKKGKHLLTATDELDQNALMIAARANNIEMFEIILSFYKSCKIDINMPDKNGYTCLHHFFSMPDLEPKMLLILLDQEDVHVNSTNRDLNTPFHYFCQKFRSNSSVKEVFDRMVAKGANVNATNKNGEAPLHKAIFNNTLAQTMVTLLLENHALVNVTNKNGESCLHYCVRMGRTDLVTILLKFGADRTITKDNQSLYDIAIQENFTKLADLLKDGVDINTVQSNGAATELITLLQNPALREDFRAFLRDELICEENISFWLDIESYKNMKIDSAQRLFKELYRIHDKYIADNSTSEINVPFSIKKDINNLLKSLPPLADLLSECNSANGSSNSLGSGSGSSNNLLGNLPPTNSPLLIGSSSPPLANPSSASTTPTSTLSTTSLSQVVLSTTTPTTTTSSSSSTSSTTTSPTSTTPQSSASSTSTSPLPHLSIESSSTTNESSSSSATSSSTNTTTSTSNQPSSSSAPSSPITNPVYDFHKIQTIYNTAQQHIFMLMATDSLSKYKKRSRKKSEYCVSTSVVFDGVNVVEGDLDVTQHDAYHGKTEPRTRVERVVMN
ncbi:hypothetical protein PPL_00326 [Heterostelium album PN500]|uniref:RGS domain-containing protein n=1 Tax=Heterostelium pallidum (strain ATCC 26659 / Pp 5 / PN500) TaxID=670386 RepID=D3AW57_HETP5|nr:hypothetical protein PPL_00326 [Heterostelium album PN500]EFA86530.1 hypothetical protein PPL_00326 [Heterostelium album PN500]|eukprot:XP_020438635.1 hypothetical protein PPL_00326 [Heterostelium album PN500]